MRLFESSLSPTTVPALCCFREQVLFNFNSLELNSTIHFPFLTGPSIPMPISFTCPECAKKLRVADDKQGRKIKCPGCQAIVTVAGCVAQKTSVRTLNKIERSTPQNVHSEFLVLTRGGPACFKLGA